MPQQTRLFTTPESKEDRKPKPNYYDEYDVPLANKDALSKELAWWTDYLSHHNYWDQYWFLDEQLISTVDNKHIAPELDVPTRLVLQKELLKIFAHVCVHVGKYPMLEYDISSAHEFAVHYTRPQKLVYFRYLVKEINPYGIPIEPIKKTFLMRCKQEVEYLESIIGLELESNEMESSVKSVAITPIKPIQWNKGNGSLMYLFKLLYDRGYITDEDFHNRAEAASLHFCDKEKRSLPKKEWQSAESNYRNNKKEKPVDAWRIEKIVDDLDEFSLESP